MGNFCLRTGNMENKKSPFHKHHYLFLHLFLMMGCVPKESSNIMDKSLLACADKPNCVSTLDPRESFHLLPFELASTDVSMADILGVVNQMSRLNVTVETENYARVECVSKVFKFVDDLELRIEGRQLIVRSESRTGYYDFNVNRNRVEKLRNALEKACLITNAMCLN